MIETIHKYQLGITDEQIISMPFLSIPLSVQFQRGILCLWARHSVPQNTLRDYLVKIVGTGNNANLSENDQFLGTAQDTDRQLVWHVFIRAV